MVQIQNTDAIRIIRDNARLSISEGFPTDLGKTVVPVMDMTPALQRRLNLIRCTVKSTTGSATIFTTSTTERTFLCGVYQALSSDVTADGINSSISFTPQAEGITRSLFLCEKQPVTAGNVTGSIEFPIPLELSKGSTVTHSLSFTVGAMTVSTIFYGYTVVD